MARAAITLLWASVHPFVLLGIGLLLFARLTRRVASRLTRNHESGNANAGGAPLPTWWLLEPLWLLALTALNPIGLWLHYFVVVGTLFSQHVAVRIAEWQPSYPLWIHLFRTRAHLNFTGFGMRDLHAVVFVITLIGLCYEVRHARRHWRSYAWHRVALSVLALTAAFFVRRFTWFMVLPVILLARNLESALQAARRTWSFVGRGVCVAFAALAFSLFGYRITVTEAWSDSHVASGYLPRDLTEFVADCGLRGNLYNPYGWGGYCIYRLYPNCRVFLDGRDHVYHRADPVVFADSRLIEIGSLAAANVLERRNIDIVLVPNGAFARSPHQSATERAMNELESTPPTRQRPPRGWRCAFINREGALFVREDSARWDACVRHMASYGITLDSSEGFDPQSVLESSPDFAFEYGMIDDLAAATLREPPASAQRQSVLGLIRVAEALRELTCARGAKAYLKRALDADPQNGRALYNPASVEHGLGDHASAREHALRAFYQRPDHRSTRALHMHMETYHRD